MKNNLDTITDLKGQLSSYFTPVIGVYAGPKIWSPEPDDPDFTFKKEICRVVHIVLDASTDSEILAAIEGENFSSAANQLQDSYKYGEVISILQRVRANLSE
jgi:hypothetical protein